VKEADMPLSKPYPVLRFGSIGDAVLLLQEALNVAPTLLARLKEDASFGSKTHARVVEFQGQKNAVRDGIVGPVTWEALAPFVTTMLQLIDKNFAPPADEAAQRQRIVDIAEASFASWGWGSAGTVTPDGSPRIAAARGFGPGIGGARTRQGGATLAAVYAIAGAGGANCLTIGSDIEAVYQQNPIDKPSQVARRNMLNQRDIGAWCGIFATYCYRASGLILRWDDVKRQLPQYFDTLGANAAVQKGDIGVFDPQVNHHFVVIQDAAPGNKVFSIDGNVGNPAEATVSPWNSVISKRFYFRSTLAGKAGRFLRPKFGAMR
jgi:hypothetical protein